MYPDTMKKHRAWIGNKEITMYSYNNEIAFQRIEDLAKDIKKKIINKNEKNYSPSKIDLLLTHKLNVGIKYFYSPMPNWIYLNRKEFFKLPKEEKNILKRNYFY